MIGTQSRPLESDEPLKVARSVVAGRFGSENKKRGLWFAAGEFWEWYGGRWQLRSRAEIEDATWLALEDSWISSGPDDMKRYKPTQKNVTEVVRAMEALVRLPHERLPVWFGGKSEMNPQWCVAFEDVIVDVRASAQKGQIVSYKRTEDWFDSVVLPGNWEDNGKCDVYRESVKSWMEGDEARQELLLRSMGYFLLPWKGFPFWWMFYGVPQSGKSTNMKVLKKLLGRPGFCGTDLSTMAGSFGMEGVSNARVICINEVYELENRTGEIVSSMVKSVLGGDEVSVNRKHKTIERAPIKAAVVMVSNEIPKLPNKGQGLSSKMKPIVFKKSWADKQDTELEGKLWGEIGGIGRYLVEAAIRMEQEPDIAKKFELDENGQDAIHRYKVMNNPLDEFLDWGFVKNPHGFVHKSILQSKFEDFERENRVRLNIPKNMLAWKLIGETTWGLSESRPHGGERVVMGLSLKPRKEVLCADD